MPSLKRPLLAFLAATALLLTSCSFGGEETPSQEAIETESAVSSLNSYVDFLNSSFNEVQLLEYDVASYESDSLIYDGSFDPLFSSLFTIDNSDLTYQTFMSPSTELTSFERSDLTDQTQDVFDTLGQIDELCKELDKYVTAQDYKDDNFAESDKLVFNLYTEIDNYYAQHNVFLETIDELFDIYETFEVDFGDPISVGVYNLGNSLDLAEELTDLIGEAYEQSDFSKASEIQLKYIGLANNWELSSGPYTPSFGDDTILTYYEYFYDDLEVNFLPVLKRSLRSLDAENSDQLGSDYFELVDNYNFLVTDFNAFLEITGY